MALIAFDPRAPEVGRMVAAAGRSVGHAAIMVASVAGEAALRVMRRNRLVVSLVGGLGTALGLGALLVSFNQPVQRETVAPAPAPTWVEVVRPLPMFAFDAPEFARAPSAFAMRRHSTGGGREDILTFGSFAGPDPYLRIVVHQVGGEGAAHQTLFVETARRAAEAGLALDGLGQSGALPTRFGAAEWAEARVAARGDVAPRSGCAIFRFASVEPQMRVSGLACGPGGAPFPRKQMSCLIGRLDLSAAGEDHELQRFFARSELARDASCAPAPRAKIVNSQPAPKARPPLRSGLQR
jgi:hypothetical protein